MKTLLTIVTFVCFLSTCSSQVFRPLNTALQYSKITTQALDISSLLDNKAWGLTPGEADFDGSQNSYPAQYHPASNFSYDGFHYNLPPYKSAGYDNLIAQTQNITVKQGKYFSVQMLAAAESSSAEGYVIGNYADGSTTSGEVLVPPWWLWNFPSGGDIVMPYYLTNETTNWNKSNIFQTSTRLDSNKDMTSLTLPTSSTSNRLHIFAITLWPVPASNSTGPHLEIPYARSTKKWIDGTDKTQIVEITVSNVGQQGWVLANDSVSVTVESEGLITVKPGTIKRLRPGDQTVVEVGVVNKDGIDAGTTGPATVRLTSNTVHNITHTFQATFGVGEYEATYESIYSHESPDWYNNAKFGIFIHWGLFSIPAWGNSGSNETYAEWYWWDLNSGPDTSDQTYEFHLENYGPDFVYDDFIANFSASAYSAKDWVDLFADSGANYFVQVTKHHDGYALFDLPSNVTKRTSVALPPHRDFIAEIFDAATEYQPHLHRATYYSLPEWFHPDYKPYGFGRWPGGNATDPFTNITIPYTGYVPVSDYLRDLVLPEMKALASMGTEIMWCDIGGPNLTAEFAAEWYNNAAASGRQVSMNNRCGLPGDFDTPEYATLSATQQRKWESNAGMDPYSYGYNRATSDTSYMNASTIVTSLVDIVSKNGNYLLDIGPTGDGKVLDIEASHLRQAGTWIKSHAEAIFNTTYWFVTPSEGDDVRFTKTEDAFYVLVMNRINSTLTLSSSIPWIAGDQVTVVGGNMSGMVIPSTEVMDGHQSSIVFDISSEVQNGDQWCWVFKIAY